MPQLNPEQAQAVAHGDGPLLVVAGPGTGKTAVITERIVHLLQSGQPESPRLSPENILALTFTEKAAGEMKHRVSEALPGLKMLPAISTFHAFCLHTLLKDREDRLLLDKIDVWIFLRRRMASLGLEYYQKLAEPGAFLHDLNEFFSRCEDELIEPGDFERYVSELERQNAQSPEQGEIAKKRELARVFRTSRRLIEESGAAALGSLVSETAALWRRDAAALAEARAQFRAVLVDEFQDTNYAQVELLKLLAPPPYAITAVGDDDQAIYRFRGASHGAFEMFRQAFPGCRTIYLNRNYRSTKRILRAAGTVIAHNDRFAGKPSLITSSDEGPQVFLVKAKDQPSEAAWVAGEIDRLAKKRGMLYSGIAVLYRAHAHRDALVRELRRRGVPIAIKGLSILSTTTLRDFSAYLRLIHSPHDNISLTRVLLAPHWRVPEKLMQSIRNEASKSRCSLYDALVAAAARGNLAGTGWGELNTLIKSFRRLAATAAMSSLAARLEKRLGWPSIPGGRDLVYPEAFSKFIAAWEEKSETRRLSEFIEYFDYFIEAGGKVEAPQAASEAVQLMTVHAAKGLEFPAVFIIGVSPRRFPATERKPVIEFPTELRKGPRPPQDIHQQEERRLFFVGMTRAKERLYISSLSKTDKQQSAFVQDLVGDSAVRTRDLEIIEAPAAEAGFPGGPRGAGFRGDAVAASPAPAQEREQGLLFGEFPPQGAGAHASIAAWASQNPGGEADGSLQLSATAVEDYLACPLKYKFQHLLKIPSAAQASLTFGNLMHRSVRRYFELRGEKQPKDADSTGGTRGLPPPAALPTVEEIQQFYLDHWRSAGFDDDYQEERYRRAGLDQLASFVEKQNAIPLDASAIRLEQPFRFNLGDVAIEGRIDQINPVWDPAAAAEGGDGPGAIPGAELVDYKTGRPRSARDAEKSLQLSVYALAAKTCFGVNPVRLALYNLTSNEAVSSVRTPGALKEAENDIQGVAAGIRRGDFEARPGFICRWCAYVPLCPAHEEED
ncbi:MAG: ATP-dependent helicase [Acidobacteriota bacterium]|nr:ATP-dependent helicase [Acidobacteriota bacterium]